MRIALDAMGSDQGCPPLVAGAVAAARQFGEEIILVGDPAQLEQQLKVCGARVGADGLSIEPAGDVIGMDEKPHACIKRPDTSMAVACRLVREGKADTVVSAGNTGASLGVSLLMLRRQKGINRPGLGSLIPTTKRNSWTFLIDIGAVVDCKPINLVQFAVMAMVYMRDVMGCPNPRIGLLSIGEEESKGNEQTLETIKLLKRAELNFIGNAEGRDVCTGDFDVVVCDGFVGNSLLKMGEGVVRALTTELRYQLRRTWWRRLMASGLRPAFRDFKKRYDHSEMGGAPLLGLNHNCIITHGHTNANAIKNSIRVAKECVEQNVVAHIQAEIERRHARTQQTSSETPEPVADSLERKAMAAGAR